jgi:hypothetical protein
MRWVGYIGNRGNQENFIKILVIKLKVWIGFIWLRTEWALVNTVMNINIFWVVMPYGFVGRYQRFRGTFRDSQFILGITKNCHSNGKNPLSYQIIKKENEIDSDAFHICQPHTPFLMFVLHG